MRGLVINGRADGTSDTVRLHHAQNVCGQLGWRCERSPAIFADGNGAERMVACGQLPRNATQRHEAGVWLAHRDAWSTAAQRDEPTVILEDDVDMPARIDAEHVHATVSEFLQKKSDVAFVGDYLTAYRVTPSTAQWLVDNTSDCSYQTEPAVDHFLFRECAVRRYAGQLENLVCTVAADWPQNDAFGENQVCGYGVQCRSLLPQTTDFASYR